MFSRPSLSRVPENDAPCLSVASCNQMVGDYYGYLDLSQSVHGIPAGLARGTPKNEWTPIWTKNTMYITFPIGPAHKVSPILGSPNPYKSLHSASFHAIFNLLFQLILQYWVIPSKHKCMCIDIHITHLLISGKPN